MGIDSISRMGFSILIGKINPIKMWFNRNVRIKGIWQKFQEKKVNINYV